MMLTKGILQVPIYAFNYKGKPIYEALTNKGHKWYDPTTCTCDDRLNWGEDEYDKPKNKK